MKLFIRLFSYLSPYKKRFIIGVVLSFFASIFSGTTLTALKPIFDVLGDSSQKPFQLAFSDHEISVLFNSSEKENLLHLFRQSPVYNSALEKLISSEEKGVVQNNDNGILFKFYKAKLMVNTLLIKYKPYEVLKLVCFSVMPLYLLKLLSVLGTVYFISSAGLMAIRDMRRELYQNLMRLPLNNFVQEKSGVWMSRVINDVTIVSDAVSNEFRVSMNNMFIVITHVALLVTLDYKLLLFSVVGVPIVLWPVNSIARKIKNITSSEQSRLGEINAHLQEVIGGIRVIRAFNMESYELSRFNKINYSLFRESFRYRYNHTIGPALVELTTSFIIIGLLLYGGKQILGGYTTPGSFLTFLFILIVIMSPVKQLATWYNLIHRTIASAERIFDLIDRQPESTDPENPVQPEPVKEYIEYKNVSFRYPGGEKDVLKKISLKVPIGSKVALVGHSGAGKSTFVDLLSRFYDPSEGAIYFDNNNVKDYRIKDLRDKVGIVTQEIILFNATVRENICYGRNDVPMEEIIRVSRMAFAHEFVEQLSNQYETVIGERGLLLSGGQRQRLSIARALLKNPEILILDEATSALDTTSERLVQKALEKLMQNRTTFAIAHRLSTIYQSDLIVVFDKGRIVETGTHDELLKLSGKYRELYDIQFRD